MKLNLSHNHIDQLPIEFFRMRELKYLNLAHNGLVDVSADLSDMVMLEVLVSLTMLPLIFFCKNIPSPFQRTFLTILWNHYLVALDF